MTTENKNAKEKGPQGPHLQNIVQANGLTHLVNPGLGKRLALPQTLSGPRQRQQRARTAGRACQVEQFNTDQDPKKQRVSINVLECHILGVAFFSDTAVTSLSFFLSEFLSVLVCLCLSVSVCVCLCLPVSVSVST